jgi:CRP-like cAMP-binding protein
MIASDAATGPGAGPEQRGLRERLSTQAEDAIGKLADDLLENPLVNSALQTAFSAREKMAQAQESAMDALNIPSASNIEKLARRLRSISQRLDEIEDGLERLENRINAVSAPGKQDHVAVRLDRIESQLDDLGRDVTALRRDVSPPDAVAAAQARASAPEG